MIDELPPTLTRVDPTTKRSAEYIRADVHQAQLDAANKRIAELEAEYKLHREASLADFLKQSDEHKSEIERLKSRVTFDCRQLLAERNARIAELEAAHRWVSAGSQLPDDWRQEVLVAGIDGDGDLRIGIGNYASQRSRWYAGCDIDDKWTVTHWMPLPPPPATNTENTP